jgi:phosphoribosylanthranilate isomerase
MMIQIYTMQSIAEAHAVISQGVNHVGITPGNRGLPGEVDLDVARAIVDAVGSSAIRVALTVESNLDDIEAMVHAVRPDILHLCPLENLLLPDDVAKLRTRLPGLPIMQAISVAGPKAIEVAKAYEVVSEYLILDTQDPDIEGIGASGETHDWTISREVVKQVNIPVILAGGLSPENVAEAIRVVRPWAVDSLTHTNKPLEEGGFIKDIDRIAQFVKAAQGAL